MKTLHGDPEEFIHDLSADRGNDEVEPRFIRICLEMRTAVPGSCVKAVSVVATYLAGGRVVELNRYVGDDWGPDFEESKQTEERRADLCERLEAAAAALSLQIRGGRFMD